MSEQIHMIMRLSDDGSVYATSPQASGLIYGRQSLAEWRSGLQDVLSFYFERPGPFDVIEHHERHYEVEGRELVTRLVAPTLPTVGRIGGWPSPLPWIYSFWSAPAGRPEV